MWHHRQVNPTKWNAAALVNSSGDRTTRSRRRAVAPPGVWRAAVLVVSLVVAAAAAAAAQEPPASATPAASRTATPTATPSAPATPPPAAAEPEAELGGAEIEDLGLDALSRRLDRLVRGFHTRAENVEPGTDAADRLNDQLTEAIRMLHRWTRSVLDTWYRTTSAAGQPPSSPDRDPEAVWSRLNALERSLDQLIALMRFNRTNLSESYLTSHRGLGPQGWRQIAFELDLVTLKVRLYKAHRVHDLGRLPERMADLLTLGEVAWHLLLAVLVIGAAVWLKRRGPGGLEGVRTAAFRSFDSLKWKRRVVRATNAAEVLLPWGSFVLAVLGLRWALGPLADEVEIDILLRIALLFGGYRMAVDSTAALLVAIGRHYKLAVGDTQRERLERSVRTVLRIAALLLVVGLVSSRWLGRGALYGLVSRFAWVVILISVLGELFRWRTPMVDTFLELSPDSRLAATVRDGRDRWYGIFLAPAAFVWLAFHGLATVMRDFALQFDETQKALAFLFRRKVEKQAEREGYADEVYDDVPREVVEAFSESSVERGPLVVARFPELDVIRSQISEWCRSGIGGAALVHGERGMGKTTWLNQLRRDDVDITRVELATRVADPEALVAQLARDLGVSGSPKTVEDLAGHLERGDRRIVVLDLAQHLFIARIGGYDAFSAFAQLVNRTRQRVFWMAAMSEYAWRHLKAVHPDCAVFRRVVALEGWSEDEIQELIQRRSKASGVVFNYADVAVDRLEGVAIRARLVESAEGYVRLLWDYSGGNPRIALHFFVRSLDPDRADRLRVRLFRAPDPERLEAGGEAGLFVLAAIVTHESLSIEDLAAVTRSTVARCYIHLDRLIDLGAAQIDDGLIRVTTTWQRAAIRLLRRRNLLPG